MKKFEFHLNTVLSYKEQVLNSRMNEYGAAVEQSNRQQRRLEQAKQEFISYNMEFSEKKLIGITALEAIKFQGCLETLESRIAQATQLLKGLKQAEELKRLELVEAKKEKASLEKLQDIKRREYDAAALKAEERAIDDLIAARRANAG